MKKIVPAIFILVIASAFAVQQQKQPASLKAAMTRGKTVY
jgi:hypothetical protein